MTSHGQRLHLLHSRREGGARAPSIVSGGGSSSQLSSLPPPQQKQPMSSHLVLPSATGPCSSLVSTRMNNRGAPSQLSISSHTRSVVSIGPQQRPLAASRSLGGSKASMVSHKSIKSTIQQEFHDIKVKKKLNALSYGRASAPYRIFVGCTVAAAVLLGIGVLLIYLRQYGELFLSLDKSEAIGPVFLVAAMILLGVAVKFLVDSYRLGARERRRLGFRATGPTMVTVNVSKDRHEVRTPGEYLVTGSTSAHAIHKVPRVTNRQEIMMESVLQ